MDTTDRLTRIAVDGETGDQRIEVFETPSRPVRKTTVVEAEAGDTVVLDDDEDDAVVVVKD